MPLFQLSTPQWLQQPFPTALCWASALAMWQSVTPGRKREGIVPLHSRFNHCTVPNSLGALDPTKFDVVAGDDNVQMGWQILQGKQFAQWNFELLLSVVGHVYIIASPLPHPAGPSGQEPRTPEEEQRRNFSHARVMYGAWNEMKTTYVMDPMMGDTDWSTGKFHQFKFMVGIAEERISETFLSLQDGWIRPVLRKKQQW